MTGIEANPVTAYGHILTIKLDEELPEFSTLCYFVPNLPTSVLLGEEGIFGSVLKQLMML